MMTGKEEKEFLCAAIDGKEEIIKKALDSNTLDHKIKAKALKYAITCGHVESTQILIDHGVDLDSAGKNENTPLGSAIAHLWLCDKEKRSDYLAITRMLLVAGANPTYVTQKGEKRFAYLNAPEDLTWEVYQIFKELGKIPIERNNSPQEYVDIIECTKRSMTAQVAQLIRIAAAEDKLSEVVNEKDAKGDCAVLWATRYNNLTIVKILAVADANFDVRGVNGYSPLDYAKHHNNQEMQALIEKNLSAQQAAAAKSHEPSSSLWQSVSCLFSSRSSEITQMDTASTSSARRPTPRPGKGKEKVE